MQDKVFVLQDWLRTVQLSLNTVPAAGEITGTLYYALT